MSREWPAALPVLVAQSPQMQDIVRKIGKLKDSNSPVLLLGETGTGKEVVARSIHAGHPERPFVPIDCSAIVGTLMESELFGHTRGAFTGAAGPRTGLLEAADGGTAFLDEIGELPLNLQTKLLRALQTKEIRPVGSERPRKSDFRIIAATNRDLAKEVEYGRFRSDLYYRLNVVTLRLPPLRERADDIPALVDHFLERHGGRYSLAPEVMEAILSYSWPGNVRELENCIDRLVAMNSGPVLRWADLPTIVRGDLFARRSEQLQNTPVFSEAGDTAAEASLASRPVLSIEEAEKRAIIKALEYTRGDRGRAAHLLGIGRTTLYRKLKQYGMEPALSRNRDPLS